MPASMRECQSCGGMFKMEHRRCRTCRATDRTCEDCGEQFKGSFRKCLACRSRDRSCTQCGEEFRGTTRLCRACQVIDRNCEACGYKFRGTNTLCHACLSGDRACEKCGNIFRGRFRMCSNCRATDRVCSKCGVEFHGHGLQCRACQVESVPVEIRKAQVRRRNNARRRGSKTVSTMKSAVLTQIYIDIMQEGACVYCGREPEVVDHVMPISRGGLEHSTNLVPSCIACNSSKYDRLLSEWREDRVKHGVKASPKVAAVARALGLKF
ncbi:HNH endonuclease [Streptomyces sp. NPDC004232]|uniref:HNH endonuclease n=1 Tax=Streptomyces sp. NPDC004232 TaxID=3154454 RepID=UPI0033B10F72